MISQLGAVGIDFGSIRSVIAVAQKGGVDILANEASNRETPNIVGYGEKERKLGEQGLQQAKSNFKNTVQFATRLLGLSKNYPKLNEELKWITSKTAQSEGDKVLFDVTLRGERIQVSPEQAVASMLNKLRQILKFNDINDNEFVLSVPSYLTESERICLLEAAKIADVKVAKLFNECSAISLSYGLFRRSELTDVPRHVIFLDLGHSKFSAFCSSFTQEKAKIVSQIHDRHLGCRDLDWTIFNLYIDEFQKKTGMDVNDSQKAVLRLLDAIEKQRQVLSANSESPCSVEYLIEDHDFSHNLKREDYEKMIVPEMIKITAHLEELKKDLELKQIDMNQVTIEVIGGGSRIPFFQRTCSEFFKKEIQRTLDASTCIARGCAMQAAMKSPLFRVAHYDLEESNYYPIRATWQFFSGPGMEIEGEKQSSIMFNYGCVLPSTKSINVNKNEALQVSLDYECAPEGFYPHLKTIIVPPSQPIEPEFSVKVKVNLDENNILHLDEATLLEDFTVEQKVPIKKEPKKPEETKDASAPSPTTVPATDATPSATPPATPPATTGEAASPTEGKAMQEEEFEIKKKQKTKHSDLKCDISEFHKFSTKQLEGLASLEANWLLADRIYVQTIEQKNELESSIYNWRDRMEGNLQAFFDVDSIKQLTILLDQHKEWLDQTEGTEVSQSLYVERLDAIQQITDVILNRERQYEELPGGIQNVLDCVSYFEKTASSTEPQYEHITPEERNSVMNQCNEVKNWLINADNTLQHAKTTLNPPFSMDDLRKKYGQVNEFCQPIMNKPKPAPPAPPKQETPPTKPENSQANPSSEPQTEADASQQEQMDVE